MITRTTLFLLKNIVYYGASLGLLSFRFSGNSMRVTQCPKTRTWKRNKIFPKLWKYCLLLSIFLSALEIHIHVKHSVTINVILVAFHEFLIVMSILMLSNLSTVTTNKYEFCSLVNEFLRWGRAKSTGLQRLYPDNGRFCWSTKNGNLLNILAFSGTSTAVSIAIIVPLISSLFPCTIHPLTCQNHVCDVCPLKTILWVLIIGLDVAFAISCALLGGYTATVSSMTLYCTYTNLKMLSQTLNTYKSSFHISAELRRKCALYYRELQILLILSNKCFQNSVWPNVQFCGSAVIISLLYSIIVLRESLHSYLVIGMTLVFCSTSCFCFLVMDYGSRPQIVSRGVLARCKERWAGFHMSKLFWKSCRPIAFQIGPFHYMDRQRGPALFRFCLQRTFFLIVQTKSVHGASVNSFVTAGL